MFSVPAKIRHDQRRSTTGKSSTECMEFMYFTPYGNSELSSLAASELAFAT